MNLLVLVAIFAAGFFVSRRSLAYNTWVYKKPNEATIILTLITISVSFIPEIGAHLASVLAGSVVGLVYEHTVNIK